MAEASKGGEWQRPQEQKERALGAARSTQATASKGIEQSSMLGVGGMAMQEMQESERAGARQRVSAHSMDTAEAECSDGDAREFVDEPGCWTASVMGSGPVAIAEIGAIGHCGRGDGGNGKHSGGFDAGGSSVTHHRASNGAMAGAALDAPTRFDELMGWDEVLRASSLERCAGRWCVETKRQDANGAKALRC